MAGQLWAPGEINVFVGIDGGIQGKNPVWLCQTEDAIHFEETHYRRKVFTDPSGGRSGPPADKLYLGLDVILAVTPERFDMTVLQVLLARPGPFGGRTPGRNGTGDRGSLLVQEGLTFPVWVRYTNPAKAAYQGMPPGLRLLYCELEGPDKTEIGLATPYAPSLVFYGYSVRQTDSSYLCYDNNMNAVASLAAG